MLEHKLAIVSTSSRNISSYMISLKGLVFDFWYFYSIDDLKKNKKNQRIPILLLDLSRSDRLDEDVCKVVSSKILNIEDIIVIIDDAVEFKETWLELGVSNYLYSSEIKNNLALTVMTLIGEKTKIHHEIHKVSLSVNVNNIQNVEQKLIIKKALSYINNRIDDAKNINDLVIAIKESGKNINQAFFDVFDESFADFLRFYKMEIAKNMLVKTHFTISKIALDLGYSSAANFSTTFKAVVSMTPSQYRKRVRLGYRADTQQHKLFKY